MISCTSSRTAASVIQLWTRPLTTSTSVAGTRDWPSLVGSRRWQIVPLSTPASTRRTWRCSFGGKNSMMRLIVSVASVVWSVDRTR